MKINLVSKYSIFVNSLVNVSNHISKNKWTLLQENNIQSFNIIHYRAGACAFIYYGAAFCTLPYI